MNIVSALLFGWLAGTLAQILARGSVHAGFLGTLFIGLLGSTVAMALVALVDIPVVDTSTMFLTSVVGAVVLVALGGQILDKYIN